MASLVTLAGVLSAACGPQQQPDSAAALDSYRSVARAQYSQALAKAHELKQQIAVLTETPSSVALERARAAWVDARAPYSKTEALRFGHWFVDEWVPRVNRWPVDGSFLDYVATDENSPNTGLVSVDAVRVGGRTLDAATIDRRLLLDIQSFSTEPTVVATGYHAIEFLLWGQDLNGHALGSGDRPWTDYARRAAQCTDGPDPAPLRHCDRRGQLLTTMVELLVWELERMTAVWADKPGTYGYRMVHGDPTLGLHRTLYGLVTLLDHEIAGERIQAALHTRSAAAEQDAFSDNTHASLYNNVLGIEQFYYGRVDGKNADVSLATLAQHADENLAGQIDRALVTSLYRVGRIREAVDAGQTFDQLIAPGNLEGSRLLADTIMALQVQAALLSRLGHTMGLGPLKPDANPGAS